MWRISAREKLELTMFETPTLIHFPLLGACSVVVAVVIGYLLHRFQLSYLAGLLCGLTVGISVVIGLFLEEGLAYPLDREWHSILWAMLAAGVLSGFVQVGRRQRIVNAVVVALLTVLATQVLLPAVGSDSTLDKYRWFWLIAPPIAAASNMYLLNDETASAAFGWRAWLIVAQLATASIALIFFYGQLGTVSLGIMAMAAVLAAATAILYSLHPKQVARFASSDTSVREDSVSNKEPKTPPEWLQVAIVPLALAAVLLTICVRTWCDGLITGWPYLPMLFLPTIISAVDSLVFKNLRSVVRILIAGCLTTATSTALIAYIWFASS